MELIERYLQAVKFWLPAEQKQDIITELSEDLYSQIEDKETELGRKLNEAEVETILRQCGRPVLVANRYLPRQYLIGPALFPIYIFVLKIVALCYLAPWILVWICLMSFSPSYRAAHSNLFEAVASAWGTWWVTALLALGTVTLVFAILERVQAKSKFLEDWNPRKLPPVRDPNRIPRSGPIIEIVINLVFGVWWWITYMSSPLILDRPDIRILLSPVWRYFFWGFLAVALANLAFSFVNLAHPYWTVRRASARLALDVVGSAVFCGLTKANIVAEITVRNISADRTSEIARAINSWMDKAFPVAVVITAAVLLGNLYRVYRVRKSQAPFAQGVAAAMV